MEANNRTLYFFAKVGAAIFLNRKRLVRQPFLFDNNTMVYIFDKTWDEYFLKIIFDGIELADYVQTEALPSYNAKDIEGICVLIPTSYEEQQKIGSYFQNLDNLISK